MNIKYILLRYFLPLVVIFMGLSLLNTLPSIQKLYYPILEKISINAMTRTQPTVYFKAGQDNHSNRNKLTVYFNSKKHLQRIYDQAKANGHSGKYTYKGFPLALDEYYITPLIFFFSLLLICPFTWYEKLASFLLGGTLLMGFTYWTVIVKGYYMIAIAGLPDLLFLPDEVKFYTLLHYLFSTITTITLVLIMWLALLLGTGAWQRLVEVEESPSSLGKSASNKLALNNG